jgi:hypothetical protein
MSRKTITYLKCDVCGEQIHVDGTIITAPVNWKQFEEDRGGNHDVYDICPACWADIHKTIAAIHYHEEYGDAKEGGTRR